MSGLHLFCLVFSLLLLPACSLFRPAADMDDGPVPERALRIAETARAQIGVRYARGGVSPRMGFDCSGLVYYAFRKNGVAFGYWDGSFFHTGNLVVKADEIAQIGAFAFTSGSDGSLAFGKTGD